LSSCSALYQEGIPFEFFYSCNKGKTVNFRKAVQGALPEKSAPVRIAVSPRNKAVLSMVGSADLYVEK